MSLLKRITSLFLTAAIVTTAAVAPIKAEENFMPDSGDKEYGKLLLLEKIGFFESMADMDWEANVKRDQFAQWVSFVANMSEEKAFSEIDFDDLADSNVHYDDIQKVTSAGYMSGTGENTFSPSAAVTKTEVAAALVRVAGYEAYATAKGGYPKGYLAVAQDLDVFDGVGVEMNTKNVLIMCYNILNEAYHEPIGLDGGNILYSKEKTLLEYFYNIHPVKGKMTANEHTKLYSDENIVNKQTLEIDKVQYESQDSYTGFLGMTVRGFYHVDEDDSFSIVSLYADNRDNRTLEIQSRDLARVENDRIYYEDDDKLEDVRLIRGYDYVYNNRVILQRQDSDLMITDGSLKLIDNNDDGTYDVVIARSAQTMRLMSVDMFTMNIYCREGTIYADNSDGRFSSFTIKDEDGNFNEGTIDNLKPQQVLTIYRSRDGYYTEILACEDVGAGTVKEIDAEERIVVLDDKSYDVTATAPISELVLGMDVDVLLDALGRIAYIESVGGEYGFSYAYLFRTMYDMENDEAMIKLITNQGAITLRAAEKILIDGVNAEMSAVLALGRQMIRYRINKNGKIRAIDTPAMVSRDATNDTLRSVTRGSMRLYPLSQMFDAKYKITADTFMTVVPSITAEREDFELYKTSHTFNTEPMSYDFELFDVDEDDMSVGAYIYYPTGSLLGQEETDGATAIGVVRKLQNQRYDEVLDEVNACVTLFTSSGEVTYPLSDLLTDRNFSFGDVVRYKVNSKGKISTMVKELDVTEGDVSDTRLSYASEGYYNFDFGRILNKADGYFVMLCPDASSNYVDIMDNRRAIFTGRMTDCWLVDMTERKITKTDAAGYAEYIAGESAPAYAYTRMHKYYTLINLIVYKF